MAMTAPRRPVGFVLQMQLKQHAMKQREGQWAKYLGIDRSLWYQLKTGKKELSMALIQRVLHEWPDEFEPFLKEAVLSWREKTPADRSQPLREVEPEGA
jgi:hypothetical protein